MTVGTVLKYLLLRFMPLLVSFSSSNSVLGCFSIAASTAAVAAAAAAASASAAVLRMTCTACETTTLRTFVEVGVAA